MLVVLAYANDAGARSLVQRWRAANIDAGLLTCSDLSRKGWVYRSSDPIGGRAVIEGSVIRTRDIRGVVTRMPAAAPAELEHVHEVDRSYATSEMQAFLLAWLSSLRCPVLNRPTPESLCGLSLHAATWVRRALRLGLATVPVRRRFEPGADVLAHQIRVTPSSVAVDVVADHAFPSASPVAGKVPDAFARAALALARDAGVEVLRVYFERSSDDLPVFLDVGVWVDITVDAVARALAERCLGAGPARSALPKAPSNGVAA